MKKLLTFTDNREFLTNFLTEVRVKVVEIDPRKALTARNKENLDLLVNENLIGYLVETFETNKYDDAPIQFATINKTLKICNTSCEETSFGETEVPPFYMIGRLIQLACSEFQVFSKIKTPLAEVFKEDKIPTPCLSRVLFKTKDESFRDTLDGIFDVIIKLNQNDKGYNEKMNPIITTIVPIKNDRKVLRATNPQLTLEYADRYLWNVKRRPDQKTASLHHEAAIYISMEFNLGFYNQGSPSMKFRIIKMITKPRTMSARLSIKTDEDLLFGDAHASGSDYEHEEENPFEAPISPSDIVSF
jgi:hypothetical protein